ncbi:MAG: NfeD family protein [Spirochaetaceae bacterium]
MAELAVLSIIGLAAMIIELFVPAGGLIGLLGIGSIITAVVRSFQTLGATAGTAFLISVLILVPTLFVVWFRYFPRTFMGKKLILMDRQSTDTGYTSHSDPIYPELEGKSGTAVTPLRPSGTVRIEGRRYSAVTDGEFIGENEKITVKKIEGNRIEVRKGESL